MSALTDVFANMDISIPADKMQQLAQKVMTGYKDYIIGSRVWTSLYLLFMFYQ